MRLEISEEYRKELEVRAVMTLGSASTIQIFITEKCAFESCHEIPSIIIAMKIGDIITIYSICKFHIESLVNWKII